jgi:glycosyltransferase involved in cell wall biosynthesis
LASCVDGMSKGQKILYIFDAVDWNSRIPVARAARERGYDVTLCLIGGQAQHSDFVMHVVPKPDGILSTVFMLRRIYGLLRQVGPDVLHTVTLKYAFLCGLATLSFARLQRVYTLAGLGYLFYSSGLKTVILRVCLKPILKILFSRPKTKLIFQNPDDMNMMIAQHYVQAAQCFLVRGSGVDLTQFALEDVPDDPPLVLMPTRLVREKGIHVFIDAARILKGKGVDTVFQIAGGETTHNPRSISATQMLEMTRGAGVEWLGRVSDMPALLARAALIVYPSYYGEGIPRVLLEACAAGRAIVTTDHTGCREAVMHGVNGLLVPIKDAQATADAIEDLLRDSARRRKMEQMSRQRAVDEFDIQKIAQKTVDVYSA